MINLKELENGDLEISVTDKEEFEELLCKVAPDERCYLWDMLENARYAGNNWYAPMDLGLTEVPAVAYGALYEDDGSEEPNDYEKLWSYNNYMITSYLEELQENGKVVFTRFRT
jgi:hypothetical protein